MGCAGDPAGGGALDCAASVAPEVATVVLVEWEAPAVGTSWVEFHEPGGETFTTPVHVGAGAQRFELAGVPEHTAVAWTATSEIDGRRWSCSGETTTGSVPEEVPRAAVSVDDRAEASGARFFLGAVFGQGRVVLVAYRRDGAVVWYHLGEEQRTALDVHLAGDGTGVLYNAFARDPEDAVVRRVTLAGEVVQAWATPGAHHMFAPLPDGTILYQQLDVRTYTEPTSGETEAWTGDAIAEIPPGGEATTRFSVWDWLDPAPNAYTEVPTVYDGVDWTHGNALRPTPDGDAVLLSLAHVADVLVVDLGSWQLDTILGADGVRASPPFAFQHDAGLLDDGNLLLFSTDADGSGAAEYRFEGDGLVEVWRHGFTADTVALGQARRLAGGNTFVNFGSSVLMQEVTPDGRVVWSLGSERGTLYGQFLPLDDLYGAPAGG